MKNNKSLTDYVFCNKCETNPCECEKDWMIEFDKKFVNKRTIATNLNNEPCVMGTAKSIKQFISSLIIEKDKEYEKALDILLEKHQVHLKWELEKQREINEDNIKNIINKYDKRINKSNN